MNSGLNVDNPTVVAAFRAALLHQGLIVLVIFAMLGLAWVSVRAAQPSKSGSTAAAAAEPAGRKLLRIGFGILWLFDGILQAQPKMAIGLPSQVIQPTAAASPHWVQVVVNWAGTAWSYHPLQAAASAVWIQVGIGLWLLAAPRGAVSRLAGVASIGWGLVVWVFGEAFGGIFAPGLTWLFGAPGAVLIYAVAGVLIALPEHAWQTPQLGKQVLAGLGAFLAGMAILQAWPGRGFWQGISHGQPGTLVGMARSMARVPQPSFLHGWVSGFASFDEAHGFAVNLFAMAALGVIGAVFLTGRARLIRPALIGFFMLCAAAWVLVEDLGFLGGLGTDPNNMIPMALLAAAGYAALVRVPAAAAQTTVAAGNAGERARGLARWRELVQPAALSQRAAAASIRSVAAFGAVGVIILGAAPMAVAQASRKADPILAESLSGSAGVIDYPAAGFTLTNQYGRSVTLASLRGKVVLLTFLDEVCTTDCQFIGQEFLQAAGLLGPANASKVELVAIVLNPTYRSVADIQAFDKAEGFQGVPNWLYLTGTLPQLQHIWKEYGVIGQDLPAGAMTLHNDQAYVIDKTGNVRQEIGTDPGPATTVTKASYASLIANAARHVLSAP
jgi:cytochrome oxidase Cu insertion factor (SCO1/SenC/PrrC family)